MSLIIPPFLQLTPKYQEYIWGGNRLRPGQLTAEAWIVYEKDIITSGAWAGCTLADVSAEYGHDLLGHRALTRNGKYFPLLIKLLDCAEWLSLQVHPNDEQALELEGPGKSGKTEAWHILDAEANAQIIAGLKPETTLENLKGALQAKTLLDQVQFLPVQTGDTVFMAAGTIHALGPGLLVYEVQQTSDITYRLFDWNRPQTGSRMLHIEKSLSVIAPSITGQALACPTLADGGQQTLCKSEYFTLDVLNATQEIITANTKRETFHALTVIEGSVRLITENDSCTLRKFESLIVPASTEAYHLEPLSQFRVLRASL